MMTGTGAGIGGSFGKIMKITFLLMFFVFPVSAQVITGKIVYTNGQPAIEQIITAYECRETCQSWNETTRTDDRGVYRIKLKPGQYRLSAGRSPLGTAPGLIIQGSPETFFPDKVTLQSGETKALDWQLAPIENGYEVYGTVTDSDGRPIAKAHILINQLDGAALIPATQTDSNGAYSLMLRKGEFQFQAQQGNQTSTPQTVQIEEDKEVNFQVETGATIQGQVEGTITYLAVQSGGSTQYAKIEQGKFRLEGLAPGPVQFRSAPNDPQLTELRVNGTPVSALMLKSGDNLNVVAVFQAAMAKISGVIEPAGGLSVVAVNLKTGQIAWQGGSSKDGKFNFQVPPGQYRIGLVIDFTPLRLAAETMITAVNGDNTPIKLFR